MKKFAQLLELLALTPSRNRKIEAMTQYFASTPDPDRGYALAILTGALTFKNVKPAVLRDVVTAEVDPILFGMSYDYVGDLGETIALIWPHHGQQQDLPSLTGLIELFNTTSKSELPRLIASLLTRAAINERWALVKLATGALRIGVNARLAPYARPVFLRLIPQLEVTGTFKQRKIDLVREGFDPAAIADPVYWFNPASGVYERLTPARYADIVEGRVKL